MGAFFAADGVSKRPEQKSRSRAGNGEAQGAVQYSANGFVSV